MHKLFYTMLGGPRTFWDGGMTPYDRWRSSGPLMQPVRHHHCHGGIDNSWFKVLMAGMFVKTIGQGISDIFRRQEPVCYTPYSPYSTFYPYVNIGNTEGAGGTTGGNSTVVNEFADIQKGFPEGKFFKLGSNYCCRIGDKIFQAESLEQLGSQMSKYIEENPTANSGNNLNSRIQV